VAKNGEDGVKMAASKVYDVVLMDIHMPIMDGYEATKRIREKNKKLPILAFTADAFEEARVKAREVGMNDFISKPFDPVLLYEKIIASLTR
jgi:CheY-like chemotaxis protein